MDKIALIIGRFQPFHKGHLALIRRYSNSGFFIKIGIGSSQEELVEKNPLSYLERKKIIDLAMKEARIKKYKIFNIPDIKKDSLYVKHVIRIVGKFNTIITGNAHVLRLFRDYNSKISWNIESFEETKRPGGEINASMIRKIWLRHPSKRGLLKSSYDYLKSMNFTKRLKQIITKKN